MKNVDADTATRDPPSAERDVLFRGPRELEVPLDSVFGVLSSRRRRITLAHLRDHQDGSIPLYDLADRVATWESELAQGTVSPDDVAVDLAHRHVPKLEEAGVVRYDADARVVEYDGGDRMDRFLDICAAEGPLP